MNKSGVAGGILSSTNLGNGSNCEIIFMNTKNWSEIIEYARWSPSVHNVQPWKIKLLSETEADLYYDSSRLIPGTDPTSALTVMSLAMFIECLSIAASPLGYKIISKHSGEEKLISSTEQFIFFSKLFLQKTGEKEILSPELIRKRKTSRLKYNGKPLEENVIHMLKKSAEDDNYTFKLSGYELTKSIISLNTKTFFLELDNSEALREFVQWMRTSKKEAKEKKDGLTSLCLGISSIIMKAIAYYPHLLKCVFIKPFISVSYNNSMRGTPAIGWLSGKFENINDWVKAGKFLLRFWLLLTKYNGSLHPLMSITFNPTVFEEFNSIVKHNNHLGEIWFIFRIGYSDEPPRSYRIETADILI